jgi:hypothetical protein
MERRTIGLLGACTAAVLLAQAAPAAAGSPPHAGAWGHPDRDDHYGNYDRHDHYGRYDRDCDHHPYTHRGYVVERLPRGYRTVHYRGDRYYYHGGLWYRPYGVQYMVAPPPPGIVIDRNGVIAYVSAAVPIVHW